MDGRINARIPFIRIFTDHKHNWLKVIFIILLALLAGVFKSLSAFYWGEAVDLGVSYDIDAMMFSVLMMLIFVGSDGLRTIIFYTVVSRVVERMFLGIRMRMFTALSWADLTTLKKRIRTGDVALRVGEDVDILCYIFADSFANYIRIISQAIFAIAVCLIINWRLSIVYFLFLPGSFYLLNKVGRAIEQLQKEIRNDMSCSSDIALSAISGIQAVKIFAMEKKMDLNFSIAVDKAYIANEKIARIEMKMTIIKYIINVVQILVLFIVGIWLLSQNLVTIGAIMTFVILSVYVTEALGMIDEMVASVKEAFVLCNRIYEILDLPSERRGKVLPLNGEEDCVCFENVNFSYHHGKPILSNLNFIVKKDQKVAVIGQSGSGKSTILSLICRFYDHKSVVLKLFGINSEMIYLDSLRDNIALVTQETCLFEGTFFDNLRFGRMDATEGEMIEALIDTNLWEFVSSLPKGLYTPLGEFASQLSGGQRQKLSIARALLKNAKLVLLDEPTSSLDPQTEQEIHQVLERLLHDRAAVVVAHRLTTVKHLDYIYCLENGTVVDEGTPMELYKKHGYYYNMCQMQGVSYDV